MSNNRTDNSGAAEAARRATDAGLEFARTGKGRWSARRKLSVVLELLRGADLESTSRKYGVTVAALSQWREAFLAAGEAGLKIRQEDLVDEQGRRMKSVIAELAMENELLGSAAGTGKTRGVSCGGLRIGQSRCSDVLGGSVICSLRRSLIPAAGRVVTLTCCPHWSKR
jgi:hypothetical protein